MKTGYFALAAAMMSTAASADTIYNTSLQNVNGPFGTSTAMTTTTSSGTRTTVTGPGPNAGANRAQGTPVLNTWFQANVGAGSTVGITTDYASNGNGSAYFNSTQGDTGKADLQYYFGSGGALTSVALSSLNSVSFDYYRDAASTANSTLAPVLRFDMLKNGAFAGALIFESAYNVTNLDGTPATIPTNSWTTMTATLSSGKWWTNNALLGPTDATAGGTKTLAQWIADNSGSTLSVYGIEIGIGSGWNDKFFGAVDNVQANFGNARTVSANFEVAQTGGAVPEPATWSMMLLGFGGMGFAMRHRRSGRATARSA